MSTESREIWAAIDIRRLNPGALETVVLVAERVRAGVLGLLVEDDLLRQVAELPFATEVVRSTGEERQLYAGGIRAESERLVAAAQQLLGQLSQARQVSCRFDIRREKPLVRTLITQASDIVLTSPAAAHSTILHKGTLQRVKLFYDSSEQALRALDMLKGLLQAGLTHVVYLISPQAIPTGLLMELQSLGARVYLIHLAADSQSLLQHLIDGPAANLQLLPASLADAIDDRALQWALENANTQASYVVN